MSREHVDAVDAAIKKVLNRRREIIPAIAESLHGTHLEELKMLQSALKDLAEAKADEEDKLPSIYEAQGTTQL